MKKILLFAFFILAILTVNAQTTVVDSIKSGGIYRTYILYKPAAYTGTTARPLVMNLHGYTSNAQQQQYYGNFMPIADTANFLLVMPQGTRNSSGDRYWNAPGFSNTNTDDIGFLSHLIDSLKAKYNINLNRVYSTGLSNGGFMSHTLACALSNKIAAIASVSGTMLTPQYGANCNPTRPVPVMQIHGTVDGTVPYNGGNGMIPVDTLVKYWVKKNNCNTVPTSSNVPNTNTTDGCTAVHYLYSGGASGSTVELYKIIGGGHSWPGAAFSNGEVTNKDINASKEIWRFFSKYQLNLLTDVNEVNTQNIGFALYPNPASSVLNFSFNKQLESEMIIEICDILGRVKQVEITALNSISIDNLNSGIYFLSIKMGNKEIAKAKFIKY